MKILIVGGAGYIGSRLIPKLLGLGYGVDVIDLLWFGNHLPEAAPVRQMDVFNLRDADLKGYEQVIFLAGLSNDPMAEFSPGMNFISNAAGPAYLGYLSKRAGVKRYIFAGSCSVYGHTVNETYSEESPVHSDSPYGISKLQGERASMQLQDDRFSVIAFRQGTVGGYSPRMRLDLVVNTMFKAAVQDGKIVVNNPDIWRPILSIEDAVDAYILALEASYDVSGIFNIASGNYTVGEISKIVQDTVEAQMSLQVKVESNRIEDYRNYQVTSAKALKDLGFKPKHDVESIVRELISTRESFADYGNANYYNIDTFRKLKLA